MSDKKIKCFECESDYEIHNHHVVPRSLGGTKTIPLCVICHGKVHNRDFLNHKKLTKEGLKNAKMRGVKLGNPQNLTEEYRLKGRESVKNNRVENPEWIAAKIFIDDFFKKNGYISLAEIAKQLNENGYKTRKGCAFSAAIVRRLVDNPENKPKKPTKKPKKVLIKNYEHYIKVGCNFGIGGEVRDIHLRVNGSGIFKISNNNLIQMKNNKSDESEIIITDVNYFTEITKDEYFGIMKNI